jgi:hypothetical protein
MTPVTTLREAKEAGQVRYFTGLPCSRGHVAERSVASRGCFACHAANKAARKAKDPDAYRQKATAQRSAWAKANAERHREIKRAWNAANPQGQAKRSREWFLANKDRANASTKAWAQANKHTVNAYAATVRVKKAKRMQASWADKALIKDIYKLAAIYRNFGHDVHVDHIVPLQGKLVSGLHVPDNLQIIPKRVNLLKSNSFEI